MRKPLEHDKIAAEHLKPERSNGAPANRSWRKLGRAFAAMRSVLIIAENVFSPVAAIHDVLTLAGEFHAQPPGHA